MFLVQQLQGLTLRLFNAYLDRQTLIRYKRHWRKFVAFSSFENTKKKTNQKYPHGVRQGDNLGPFVYLLLKYRFHLQLVRT